MKNEKEFAKELSDAPCTKNFKCWIACIRLLRKRNYNDEQIEAIIRSKWMRWCAEDYY